MSVQCYKSYVYPQFRCLSFDRKCTFRFVIDCLMHFYYIKKKLFFIDLLYSIFRNRMTRNSFCRIYLQICIQAINCYLRFSMVDELVDKAVICDKSGCKILYLIFHCIFPVKDLSISQYDISIKIIMDENMFCCVRNYFGLWYNT